jgi:hypothetical protein
MVLCNSSLDPRNVAGYATSEHVAGLRRELRLQCYILIALFVVRFGELMQDVDDKLYACKRFRHHQSYFGTLIHREKKEKTPPLTRFSRACCCLS